MFRTRQATGFKDGPAANRLAKFVRPDDYERPESCQRARAARSATYREGSLIPAHGDEVEVVVKNVSASGARVDFRNRARLSGRVLLSSPALGLRKWCRVAWCHHGMAGICFET
ncbi:MAG: hypothetical protein MI723_09940 [Caulobacterales bacterium]|nr:hypothetical protein [Caulobacterales bacterium]